MHRTKGLILGSAAALIVSAGAQAADLPVKAKAVEYVKVCSLYGAGFWYIPGTDTCIKLGGYLRADVVFGTNSDYNGAFSGVAGANNRYANEYTTRARQDLTIDLRTATEYGVVRTFADLVFSWTSGGFTGTGSATGASAYDSANPAGSGQGQVGGGNFGLYHAYIQFAGFTLGRSVSQFDAPWVNYPGNNFDGLAGGGGTVTGINQLSYTAQFGNGVSLSVGAQETPAYISLATYNTAGITAAGVIQGVNGSNGIGGQWAPDGVAALRVDQAWGLFQASFAAHQNHVGYYGATEFSGAPADKWGYAGQVALSIKNLPTGPGDTINMQAVYTEGATRYNFQSLIPASFSMYGGTNLAGAYQSVGFASLADTVYGPGGSQQLVKTYGGRGAFTHNWDAYWNTSVYGSYAVVDYGATGRALVCGAVAASGVLTAGSTCNPNFSLATVGMTTRWTPVRNLTFSADVAYTMLDQRYSGAVAAPAIAATAKPAAVYQIKDQNTLNVLLRAQRTF